MRSRRGSRHLRLLGTRRTPRATAGPWTLIGRLLEDAGVVTAQELQAALLYQKDRPHRRIGTILHHLGLATGRHVAQALAAQFGVPFVDGASLAPEPGALAAVSRSFAYRHHVVPLRSGNGWIEVAVADPTNAAALAVLRRAAGTAELRICVGSQSEIDRTCDRAYALVS